MVHSSLSEDNSPMRLCTAMRSQVTKLVLYGREGIAPCDLDEYQLSPRVMDITLTRKSATWAHGHSAAFRFCTRASIRFPGHSIIYGFISWTLSCVTLVHGCLVCTTSGLMSDHTYQDYSRYAADHGAATAVKTVEAS